MPFELQPGEQVFFPAPFIPTEHNPLIISNRRVVQYAALGPFPIAEFEVGKIEHIGRMSKRPLMPLAIMLAILGLIFFIVGTMKVLPAVLFAGQGKANPEEAELTDDGRLVEGKNSDDDFPTEFGDKEVAAGALKRKAEKLKKLKEIKPGLPPITSGFVFSVLSVLGGIGLGLIARKVWRKEDYYIFCRTGEQVYTIQVASSIQENVVLSTLSAAKTAAASAPA